MSSSRRPASTGEPLGRSAEEKLKYLSGETKTFGRTFAAPILDRDDVIEAALALGATLDPDREVRLLGVRAEMTMPDGGHPVRGRI